MLIDNHTHSKESEKVVIIRIKKNQYLDVQYITIMLILRWWIHPRESSMIFHCRRRQINIIQVIREQVIRFQRIVGSEEGNILINSSSIAMCIQNLWGSMKMTGLDRVGGRGFILVLSRAGNKMLIKSCTRRLSEQGVPQLSQSKCTTPKWSAKCAAPSRPKAASSPQIQSNT